MINFLMFLFGVLFGVMITAIITINKGEDDNDN